jgi:hypothetical protein
MESRAPARWNRRVGVDDDGLPGFERPASSGANNRAGCGASGCKTPALLGLDPSAHYAQYALGMSLKQHGRIEESRTRLRLAVVLSPETELYREALGRLPPAQPHGCESWP